MIGLQGVSLFFGDRVLFNKVDLSIQPRDRIGLVGRNGAGKSTLLKVLTGDSGIDEGRVVMPKGTSIGYLHQDMSLESKLTVVEETRLAFEALNSMKAEISLLESDIEQQTDYESEAFQKQIDRLTDLTTRLSIMGEDQMDGELEKVLTGLGFTREDLSKPVKVLSGGWKMRIVLAKMLLQKPDFMLLDEPTNHLDIESIMWLEQYLTGYEGAIVVISHDRAFLDHVTNRTVEVENGKLIDYPVSYSKYVTQREVRREQLQQAYDNQQKLIAQKERVIDRFRAKASKAAMAQSMIKQLSKMERIETDEINSKSWNVRFPEAPRSGEVVVDVKNVSKAYGTKKVLSNVDFSLLRGERVAFVGQNGQGKTTLAKLILNLEPCSSGIINLGHNVSFGYYAQDQAEALDQDITVLQSLESVAPYEWQPRLRGLLGSFLFSGDDVDKKVKVLSGGERARLALAKLIMFPFNLLLLDEPTNHLDMVSKDVLKQALMAYTGSMIVVSHDREFLEGLTSRVVEFRDQKLKTYLGDITYFLEQRQLDNMRQVEMATKSVNNKPAAAKENQQQKKHRLTTDRKNLQKQTAQLEKAIAQIEERKANCELDMSDPEFYSRPDMTEILEKYKNLQNELANKTEQWESLQFDIELIDEELGKFA